MVRMFKALAVVGCHCRRNHAPSGRARLGRGRRCSAGRRGAGAIPLCLPVLPAAGLLPALCVSARQPTRPRPALTPEQQKAEADRQASLPYGRTCYAGFYTCAAPPYTHVGTGCSCPGIGAPSYGTVN